MKKAIVLLSGGMDSTTLAHQLAADGYQIEALAFDYGQRHGQREIGFARKTGRALGVFSVVRLRQLAQLLGGSALTDPDRVRVPEGHYSADTMKATVVPNRNAIMLNIAVGVAVAQRADIVATAVHAGDHPIYPDCRPEFIEAMNALIEVATDGFAKPGLHIEAPFVDIPKDAICRLGDELGVDWSQTWSCYVGGSRHCGRCGTCVERAEAFHLAGVEDPTVYRDSEFWRDAVAADEAEAQLTTPST